jgi:hypothetical protein
MDRTYADGPDIWPSAYATAVGAASHSCSVYVHVIHSYMHS